MQKDSVNGTEELGETTQRNQSEFIERLGVAPAYQVWECKLVIPSDIELPSGFDATPRSAVQIAIENKDIPILALFSGWGGALSESERIVVEAMNP